jgi:hypothetical protein
MQYRILANAASVAALAALVSASAPAVHSESRGDSVNSFSITVFKDPNCRCCKSWVEHLRKHGFDVVVRDTSDVGGAKRAGRVPERLHSCHTAFVNGYVVEGHVPASDIQRLLNEKAKVAGLAVPGMPVGSPGMEMGGRVDHFEVVGFNRDGTTRTFARH